MSESKRTNVASALNKVSSAVRKLKPIAIIAGIIMIAFGIVMFCNPAEGGLLLIWLMVIGLLIFGIVNIVLYCKLPVGVRDGTSLGMGVLWVIISGFMIYAGIVSSDLEKEIFGLTYSSFIAIMLGFGTVFAAVEAFMSCGIAERAGQSPIWNIISGILLLIAAIIIFSDPIGSGIAANVVFGIFSVINGIRLICRVASL